METDFWILQIVYTTLCIFSTVILHKLKKDHPKYLWWGRIYSIFSLGIVFGMIGKFFNKVGIFESISTLFWLAAIISMFKAVSAEYNGLQVFSNELKSRLQKRSIIETIIIITISDSLIYLISQFLSDSYVIDLEFPISIIIIWALLLLLCGIDMMIYKIVFVYHLEAKIRHILLSSILIMANGLVILSILGYSRKGSSYELFQSLVLVLSTLFLVSAIIFIFEERILHKQEMIINLAHQKTDQVKILAGGLIHDFNNLLSAISGNIDLLDYTELDAEQKEILNDLRDSSNGAINLAHKFMDFTRSRELEIQEVVLEDQINHTIRTLKKDPHFEISLQVDSKVSVIEADPIQLGEVLINLILNAKQSMVEKGIVSIKVKKSENILQDIREFQNSIHPPNLDDFLANQEFVLIYVIDTGKGISKSDQSKLFIPYFTTNKNGSGLGLTTSERIIEKHHGFITFLSNEGKGTTFLVGFPLSQKQV